MVTSSEIDINEENFLKFANSRQDSFEGNCFLGVDGLYDNVIVTGHSLGGALAAIVANKFGVKGYVFNAPGIIGLRNKFHRFGYELKASMSDFCLKALEIVDRKHALYVLEEKKNPDLSEFDIEKYVDEEMKRIFDPQEIHILDIMNIYEQEDVVIEWNEVGNRMITNYFVEHNFTPREIAIFGKWCAVGGVKLMSNPVQNLHSIRQFSDVDERYDANGEIDLEKEINWTRGLRELKKYQKNNV